jgi:outer membrane lipoprotein LolB
MLRGRFWLALLVLLWLAGCAAPVRAPAPADAKVWNGRLALTVEGRERDSFSSTFELKGEAQAGELTLFTPLGGVAAVVRWAPGSATLRSGNEVQQFDSLDALTRSLTGEPLPIAVLFDWLAGRPTQAAGWEADVSQLAQGRLRARRTMPLPAAELRVAFDR